MDKHTFTAAWDQFRQKYGIYLRLLDTIPEDQYHSHPVPGIRTPAELVVHTSGSIVRDIAQGVAKGAITANEAVEGDVAAGLATKADIIAFARTCWDQANAAAQTIGDKELSQMVPTPWHMTFPGWVGFSIQNDEFMHHRGQLYAIARLAGAEPPFMWGFADNEPAFKPAS
jgi:uncharacterized damage-inducible protein DinB